MKKETRTKTVKETVYIASDGKEFSGENAELKCKRYEVNLNKEDSLWHESITRKDTLGRYFTSFDDEDNFIDFVYLESKKDFEAYLLSLNDSIFYENSLEQFTSPGWYILNSNGESDIFYPYPVSIMPLEDELYRIEDELCKIAKEYRNWTVNVKQALDNKYLKLSKKYKNIKPPDFSSILN